MPAREYFGGKLKNAQNELAENKFCLDFLE
jgi:hypothetical protein